MRVLFPRVAPSKVKKEWQYGYQFSAFLIISIALFSYLIFIFPTISHYIYLSIFLSIPLSHTLSLSLFLSLCLFIPKSLSLTLSFFLFLSTYLSLSFPLSLLASIAFYISEYAMDWIARAMSESASNRMIPIRVKSDPWLKSIKIWIELPIGFVWICCPDRSWSDLHHDGKSIKLWKTRWCSQWLSIDLKGWKWSTSNFWR